jgi:hypothetical protein
MPRISRRPSPDTPDTPVATTSACDTTPPADADVEIRRVEEQVGEPGVLDPAVQELVHLLIDLGADAGDR